MGKEITFLIGQNNTKKLTRLIELHKKYWLSGLTRDELVEQDRLVSELKKEKILPLY